MILALLGYVVGWWWRGLVERWLEARERRIADELHDVDFFDVQPQRLN